MGLDYSYRLFFKRRAFFDVLERLAQMAEFDPERQTALVFHDRVVSLPFEGWLDTGRQVDGENPAPKWDFMTVLQFDLDEAITDYMNRRGFGEPYTFLGRADNEMSQRVGLGIIYLTVYNDLKVSSERLTDPDLVLFEFDTPGTSMSILFTESMSIRQAFINLLVDCQGVYGLLDMENEAELIWMHGEEMSVMLPHAYLSLPEIEAYARGER